jgi:multicomponent Na+:H+ antiporter subunit E
MTTPQDVPLLSKKRLPVFLVRLALFSVLWWVLAVGNLSEPALAVVSILAATLTSMALWPSGAWRWRTSGLARFVPWFLWMSVLGGWDVARRAFDPKLPLDPGFVHVTLQVRSGPARVFLVWVLSLIPGTVASRLEKDRLTIHVIDRHQWTDETVRELEAHVMHLFRGESAAERSA